MKHTIAFFSILALAATANAEILFSDTFTYTDGNLVGATGSTWANHSGTGSFIQVSGGEAIVAPGGGSREDANALLSSAQSSGTVYFGFDISVANADALAATDYIVHLKNDATGFTTRIFLSSFSGSDYTIGMDNSSTMGNVWASGFTFGSTQQIVASYNIGTGTSQLWVNPVDASSTSLTDAGGTVTDIYSIALRQGSGLIGTSSIDNVVVATTFNEALTGAAVPEPSTYAAIAGILGLGLAIARRKRA